MFEQLAPFAVLIFGRAGEAQRVALDFDDLRRDVGLEALRELLQRIGVYAGVGIFLDARHHRGNTTHGAGGAHRIVDAAGVVGAAGIRREDAGEQRRGTEHGARACARAGAHFFLEQEYGIEVEAHETDVDNFDRIEDIAAFVERKRAAV